MSYRQCRKKIWSMEQSSTVQPHYHSYCARAEFVCVWCICKKLAQVRILCDTALDSLCRQSLVCVCVPKYSITPRWDDFYEAVCNKVARISRHAFCTQVALFQARSGSLPSLLENLTTAIFFKKCMAVSQKLPFLSMAKQLL